MTRNLRRIALGLAALAASLAFTACNGSSQPQSGTVHLALSDAPSDDWATIGARVRSVSLVPQGGGAPVNVYTAPSPAPFVNLPQLDDLADIVGDLQVPAGTYTGVVVTLAGNPGDVLLTVGADPDPDLAVSPGTQIPPDQIVIRGASGTAGNRTVSVPVPLEAPLVVKEGESEPLDMRSTCRTPSSSSSTCPRRGLLHDGVQRGPDRRDHGVGLSHARLPGRAQDARRNDDHADGHHQPDHAHDGDLGAHERDPGTGVRDPGADRRDQGVRAVLLHGRHDARDVAGPPRARPPLRACGAAAFVFQT